MGTVLVDTYEVRCGECGFRTRFLIGAGAGDLLAVDRAKKIHDAQSACDDKDKHLELEVRVISRA